MNKLNGIIVFLVISFCKNAAFSQANYFDTTMFSVKELQEDFNFWKDKLEKKAPLLYLYNSKNRTNHYLDSLYRLIDHPMSPIEFYRILVSANSFLKDQHTCIFPSTRMFNEVSSFPNLLPVDIQFIERTTIITTNYTSCKLLQPGIKVMRINGISCNDIIEKLHASIQRDGNSLTLPIETINRNFWFYYHLIYGTNDSYDLQIVSEDGKIENCVVPGMHIAEMESQVPQDVADDPHGIYLDFLDTLSAGVLTISDYSSSTFKSNQGKSFKRLVDEHFEAIRRRGIEVLIIDVRNNQGGNPNNVKHTLKHLFDHPFELITEVRQVKKHREESFDKRTGKRWYPTLGIGTYKPHKDAFKGKVYVLMNGRSLSATAELISVLNRYDRAEFIGTMSGGSPHVLSGSLTKGYWELPNTKLKAFVPNKCQILGALSSNAGLGLKPDHAVEPKIKNVSSRHDPVLEYVIELLQSNTID